MSKKIHVRPSKSQSKIGFIAEIIFCIIGVIVVIPTFGLFGVVWTAFAGLIAYSHYRNGFTDKPINTKEIEIEENGEERLTKLLDLYTKSLITSEEYEQKKKEILDEL